MFFQLAFLLTQPGPAIIIIIARTMYLQNCTILFSLAVENYCMYNTPSREGLMS